MHTCSSLTFYAWFNLTYWYTSMSPKKIGSYLNIHVILYLNLTLLETKLIDYSYTFQLLFFHSYGDTHSCNIVQTRWFKLWIKFTSRILRSNLINASGSTTCRIAWLRFSGLAYITLNLMSESKSASMNCSFANVSITSPGVIGYAYRLPKLDRHCSSRWTSIDLSSI